ncbi:MAG: hypothetical protein IPK97_13185 [Ahniella sp.]|nr:hypothetical protein [Ahniella sp.]
MNALREYVTQRQTLSESPELTGELTRYAEAFQFHVAYYLLSLLRRQSADYDGAEKFGKVAESLVKDDCPLLWYCGLIDTAGLSQKEAQKAAKSIYKANREEIKPLRSSNGSSPQAKGAADSILDLSHRRSTLAPIAAAASRVIFGAACS